MITVGERSVISTPKDLDGKMRHKGAPGRSRSLLLPQPHLAFIRCQQQPCSHVYFVTAQRLWIPNSLYSVSILLDTLVVGP